MSINLFNTNSSSVITSGIAVFFANNMGETTKKGLTTVFLDGARHAYVPVTEETIDGESVYVEPDGAPVPASKVNEVFEGRSGGFLYKKLVRVGRFAFSGPHSAAVKNIFAKTVNGKPVRSFVAHFTAAANSTGNTYDSADGQTVGVGDEIFNVIGFQKTGNRAPTTPVTYVAAVVPTGKKDGSVYGVGLNKRGEMQASAPIAMPRFAGKDAEGNAVRQPDYASLLSDSPAVIEQFKLLAKGRFVWVRGKLNSSMKFYNGEWRLDRVFNAESIDTDAATLGSGVASMTCDPIDLQNGSAMVYAKTRSDGRRRGETVDVDIKIIAYDEEAVRLLSQGAKGYDILLPICGVSASAWNDKESGEAKEGVNVTAYSLSFPKTKNTRRSFITFGMGNLAQKPTAGALKNGQPISSLRIVSSVYNSETKESRPTSVDIIGIGQGLVGSWTEYMDQGRSLFYIATLLGAGAAFVPQTGANVGQPVSTLKVKQIHVEWLNKARVVTNASVGANAAPVVESIPESDAPAATDPIGGTDNPADFSKKMSEVGRKALEGAGEVAKKAGAVASDIVGGLS